MARVPRAAAVDVGMDVPRVDSAQLRAASAQTMADTGLDLVRGDRFTATVVAIHASGDVVLATPRGSLVSQSDVRLAPGQSLALEVVRDGAAPVLRIVGGASHFDEQAFAEAVLEAVRRDVHAARRSGLSVPEATMRQHAVALRLFAGSPEVTLTSEQRAAAARLLSPVDPQAPPDEIAGHVRALVEDGGTLLEPHLRAAIHANGAAHGLPGQVARDLRVVLAALLASGTGPAALADTLQRLGAELGREVLDRQLDQALHWVRSGTLVADLPITENGDDRVRMEYRREHSGDGGDEATAAHAVRLTFELASLGQIDVVASWAHGAATLQVRVGDEVAGALVAEGLLDLRSALQARGLTLTTAGIRIGPPVAAAAHAPGEPPAPGSILRQVG